MRLTINGTTRDFEGIATLPDLLAVLNLPHKTLLVELNGEALHQSEWPECRLRDGDALEFLQIAAGG